MSIGRKRGLGFRDLGSAVLNRGGVFRIRVTLNDLTSYIIIIGLIVCILVERPRKFLTRRIYVDREHSNVSFFLIHLIPGTRECRDLVAFARDNVPRVRPISPPRDYALRGVLNV